jgi:hypothetical protein
MIPLSFSFFPFFTFYISILLHAALAFLHIEATSIGAPEELPSVERAILCWKQYFLYCGSY